MITIALVLSHFGAIATMLWFGMRSVGPYSELAGRVIEANGASVV